MVQTQHEKLLSNKKEHSIDSLNNLDDSPENHVKWEKRISKVTYGKILYIYNILEVIKL